MLKFLKVLFVAAILVSACTILFSIPVMAATNYYVSTSGDDNNNGTSSTTPWKTLAKASTITYASGDQLLLKCGDSWNEQLTLKGTGTSSAPITVDSYDTGNAPRIYGNWPTSIPVEINDNDAGITYSGIWGYNTGATGYYNSDYHYCGTADNYVQYTATGTSISWIGPLGSNEGKADVYIDSVYLRVPKRGLTIYGIWGRPLTKE